MLTSELTDLEQQVFPDFLWDIPSMSLGCILHGITLELPKYPKDFSWISFSIPIFFIQGNPSYILNENKIFGISLKYSVLC